MYECPVCFEQLNENNTSQTDCCNQKSCKNCLIEWQKSSKICIYCDYEYGSALKSLEYYHMYYY